MCSEMDKEGSLVPSSGRAEPDRKGRWLNRNVFAFGLTSFLGNRITI